MLLLLERNVLLNLHVEHRKQFSFEKQDHPHFRSAFAYVERLEKQLKYWLRYLIDNQMNKRSFKPRLAVYDETRIRVKNDQRQLIIRVDGAVGFRSVPE